MKERLSALRGYLRRGDVMIVALLLGVSLALGVAALLPSGDGARLYAVVRRGGEEAARLPLDENAEFVISDSDAYNVIKVEGGAVYMLEADCPDGLCIRAGRAERSGETIVCLPNRVSVTVEAEREKDNDVDTVAY